MSAALYMLDTDTCIFLMRGSSATLDARVQSVLSPGLVMSAMTLAELRFGVEASARAQQAANRALLDALALEATVVTNNVKDFGRVPGLAVENWMK